ncbi:hypothetical protein BB558_003220 [Smittium angustum]|uniref:Transmembrane 9 superfamily member n=1 Tax=Smittium angustum TaxID=133377 RepID=A0A2U1J6R7_SMIAN|nr:hypothetical protein BB558_003220 [Smittium angustum]
MILGGIALLGTIATCLFNCVDAYYMPGLAPINYKEGDKVELQVNALVPSINHQKKIKAIVPYDYYHKGFGFCRPDDKEPKQARSSLGSILFGDRIYESPFKLSMKVDEKCKFLCKSSIDDFQKWFLIGKIKENYRMDWLIDGLPAIQSQIDGEQEPEIASIGFPLGYAKDKNTVYIYNHYDIQILYHDVGKNYNRVVGVSISPKSKKTESSFLTKPNCETAEPLNLALKSVDQIVYTYSVTWKKSDITWSTRWDSYLAVKNSAIHWISLVSSFIIVLFLAGMVALIFLRVLRKEILQYNSNENDAMSEDFGWKLVHGDVFRPPQRLNLLCVLVGSGYQIFYMILLTIVFALLGLLSPSNRGSLTSAALAFYMLFGFSAGNNSSHLYNSYGGTNRKSNVLYTIFFIPA